MGGMTDPALSHPTLAIVVNGEHRRVAAGLTLAGLAAELGLEPTKVAVERNFGGGAALHPGRGAA